MFSNIFSKIVAIYETVEYCKARQPQMTTGCKHITCWIPKATNIPSKYVIFIVFLLQQWLHKHVSMLHYERTLPVLFHIIYVCPVLTTTVTDVQWCAQDTNKFSILPVHLKSKFLIVQTEEYSSISSTYCVTIMSHMYVAQNNNTSTENISKNNQNKTSLVWLALEESYPNKLKLTASSSWAQNISNSTRHMIAHHLQPLPTARDTGKQLRNS
jgi:hypothetical protein